MTHNERTENTGDQTGQVERPLPSDNIDEETEEEGADGQA